MANGDSLETRDLRLVQAIAEHGGVTHAARRLHLSQSAVSHQLTGLEARLGVQLFDRVKKRMVINAAGRRLVTLAAEVLPRLELVEAQLRKDLVTPRRTMRLSTQCYTAYHWFPRMLRQLTAAHPELDVQIAVEATRTPVEAMLEDRLDVALCCFPARDRRLVETPLFEDEMVAVLPSAHPLAGRPYLNPRELLGETVFSYELPPDHERELLRELFGAQAHTARFRRVPLTEAMIELVRTGHGVSFMARWSLGPYLERGELAVRRLGRQGMRRPWSLVHPRSSPFQPELRTLAELLRTTMSVIS